MQRVELTDEMRSRILLNVGTRTSGKRKGRGRIPAVAAAAAALVLVSGMWRIYPLITDTDEPDESMVGDLYNEQSFDSADELSAAVGFAVPEIKTMPYEVLETRFLCICGNLAEIEYVGAQDCTTFRMSEGTQDNSGNYEVYPTERNVQITNQTVTLKGKEGRIFLALWTADGYACSLSDADGLTETEAVQMIEEIMRQSDTAFSSDCTRLIS